MTHDEIIAIVQAHKRGETIQYKSIRNGKWMDCYSAPSWDFHNNQYRIKPREPREWWVRVGAGDPAQAYMIVSGNKPCYPGCAYVRVREVIEPEQSS